jgi:hypothetical protein
MIGIAFSPTLGSMSAIPKPCKSTSITMCFDDEGRHLMSEAIRGN